MGNKVIFIRHPRLSKTTVSTRILPQIQQQPDNIPAIHINTAERPTSACKGFRKLTFQLGEEIIHCPAIVLPSESYDLLLSTNIMGHLRANVDFATSQLRLPNGNVSFNWRSTKQTEATLAFIEPHCRRLTEPKWSTLTINSATTKLPTITYFQLYPQINTSFSEATATLYISSAHPTKLGPHQQAKVATGLVMDIPEGVVGLVFNHHWSTQMELEIVTGILYPKNYQNLVLLVINTTDRELEIPAGQRVAVVQFLPLPDIQFERSMTMPSSLVAAPKDVPIIQTTTYSYLTVPGDVPSTPLP